MILYVDETECDDFFVVAGLLTISKEQTDLVYKQFKKKLKSMKLSEKDKRNVFQEFKAVLLDKHYQKIKIKMLKELNSLNYNIVFSAYLKKPDIFNQQMKEEQYIILLKKIVSSINSDIDIIFDTFNKHDFESKIIEELTCHSNVKSIKACDSRMEAGLQFIDNICSTIRLYRTGVNLEFYKLIDKNIVEV